MGKKWPWAMVSLLALQSMCCWFDSPLLHLHDLVDGGMLNVNPQHSTMSMYETVGSGASLTANQGSLVRAPVRPHTFVEILFVCLFVLRLNVPVNNFSVMSGWSNRFLGN